MKIPVSNRKIDFRNHLYFLKILEMRFGGTENYKVWDHKICKNCNI